MSDSERNTGPAIHEEEPHAQLQREVEALRRRLRVAEKRAREAEQRANKADQHTVQAEVHVALAEARARRLMAVGRRYKTLVANLPDTTLVVYDSDLRYQVVEGGHEHDAMEGLTLHEIFSPSIATRLEGLYRRTLTGDQWEREITYDDKTFLVQGRPLRDDAGAVTAGLVLSRDITRLKTVEQELRRERANLEEMVEEREVLLREVYHRVKNNLQVVSSLLSLQSRTIEDPDAREAMSVCRQRVAAMARVHEQLYRSADVAHIDLSAYLSQLSSEVERTYRPGPGIQVELNLEPVDVDLERAIPVGLIAHELLANAFRHAFREGVGTIRVRLSQGEHGSFDLQIQDDGVGITELGSRRTLGTRLVRDLATQVEGTLDMQTEAGGGTAWTLHIPGAQRWQRAS